MNTRFYIDYFERYLDADEQTRQEALDHWRRCDEENRKQDRPDLIMFSSKMLTIIELADRTVRRFERGSLTSL